MSAAAAGLRGDAADAPARLRQMVDARPALQPGFAAAWARIADHATHDAAADWCAAGLELAHVNVGPAGL
ncbi:MAG TPA: hypothetical protein VKY65_00185, partial [Alphaproteobacteria bacterium]|nr:hypothetical protein [Alphaproteobacteria bacterium]